MSRELLGSIVPQRSSKNLGDRGLTLTDVVVWSGLLSTALPTLSGVEWKADVSIGSIYISDPMLLLSALLSARYVRRLPLIYILGVAAMTFCLLGLWRGGTIGASLRDTRPVFYLVSGMMVGCYILCRPESVRLGAKLIVCLIAFTTLLGVVSQFVVDPIVGDVSGSNEIYFSGERTVLESRRVQSEPIALALLVLCFLLSCSIFRVKLSRYLGVRWYSVALGSSIVLTLLAYSRNSLAAIFVTLVLALLIPASSSRTVRTARLFQVLAVSLVIVVVPVWIGWQYGLFSNVIETFSARVLKGIAPDVIATDPSVGWRYVETNLAFDYILQNPILGSGLGGYYRDRVAGEPFTGNAGRLYVHNYFVLVLVKFGVVGGLILIFLFLLGLGRMIRAGSVVASKNAPLWSAAACAFLGIFASNLVAPSLMSRSFAAFGGAVLAMGLLAGAKETAARSEV